ncbi:unnamed protein product, partial [Staurois parvus]
PPEPVGGLILLQLLSQLCLPHHHIYNLPVHRTFPHHHHQQHLQGPCIFPHGQKHPHLCQNSFQCLAGQCLETKCTQWSGGLPWQRHYPPAPLAHEPLPATVLTPDHHNISPHLVY